MFSLSQFQKVIMRNEGLGKVKTSGLRTLLRLGNGETGRSGSKQAGGWLPHALGPASVRTAAQTQAAVLSLRSAVPWHLPGAATVRAPIKLPLGRTLIILWAAAQGEPAR